MFRCIHNVIIYRDKIKTKQEKHDKNETLVNKFPCIHSFYDKYVYGMLRFSHVLESYKCNTTDQFVVLETLTQTGNARGAFRQISCIIYFGKLSFFCVFLFLPYVY